MDRIDDLFAVGAPPVPSVSEVGNPGWFSGLVAGAGVRATRVRYWWLNAVQGALLGLLDAAQIAHSKTDYSRVTRAVTLIGRRRMSFIQSTTWTVPAGCYGLTDVVARGGGGPGGHGNGGAGGGGSDGNYYEGYLPVEPGDVVMISLGNGGNPGIPLNGGVVGASAGGTTTIAINGIVVVTCPGGGGGGLGPTGRGNVDLTQATGVGDRPYNQAGQNGLSTPQSMTGGMGGGGHSYMGGLAQPVATQGSADGNGGQLGCGGSGGAGNGIGGTGGGGYASFKY